MQRKREDRVAVGKARVLTGRDMALREIDMTRGRVLRRQTARTCRGRPWAVPSSERHGVGDFRAAELFARQTHIKHSLLRLVGPPLCRGLLL